MSTIPARRLHNQGLDHPRFETPAEVVAWFGAVQAQEYPLAKWALGLRLAGATGEGVEQALTDGQILRTHVMRPTWHFVARDDIRWLLELTAPRVNRVNGSMYRRLELDDAVFARSNHVISRALEGGRHLTRAELGTALEQAGIDTAGLKLGYLVHRAELDALICSGVRRGKHATYALLAERAPAARSLPRDEALAMLARRFFTSHGPATLADFAWWSGLTQADGKRGAELSELAQEQIDGRAYWYGAHSPVPRQAAPDALLLPPFDEYTIGYRDHRALLEAADTDQPTSVIFDGVLVIGGIIVGNWRRMPGTDTVTVELKPFRQLSSTEHEAAVAAARRFGAFLDLPVTLTIHA